MRRIEIGLFVLVVTSSVCLADIEFVSINDPGFTGYMSKYETTNDDYAQFLTAALASGDITMSGNDAVGASGSNSGADHVGLKYYDGDGLGLTSYGATNGGGSRINYNAGVFSVDSGFGNHPATFVSWYGATAFSNYYGYYLPTEDQWQAVADYNGTFNYGCGLTIDTDIANYRYSLHPDGTTPVGSFDEYGYDMFDMAGNVSEWTSSVFSTENPAYSGIYNVVRGGSWRTSSNDCAVSDIDVRRPGRVINSIGFRVATDDLTVVPTPSALLLGGLGLAVAGYRLRKRKTTSL